MAEINAVKKKSSLDFILQVEDQVRQLELCCY